MLGLVRLASRKFPSGAVKARTTLSRWQCLRSFPGICNYCTSDVSCECWSSPAV